MRNIFFLFVFFSVPNFCQKLTGYYPLETGNVWEYWDPWDSLFIFKDTIIGDSVASNGKTYKVRKTEYWDNTTFYALLRFDDNKLYGHGFESDGVIYDFTKTTGDTLWVIYYPDDTVVYRITFDYYNNFYGKFLRHTDYYYESTTTSYYNIDRVVDSIGLIYINFEPGIEFFLRGAIINGVQYGTITSIDKENINLENFFLFQNYPNPFNSVTQIEFTIPERENVTIKVYDILGRLIKILIDGEKEKGRYRISFDSKGLSAGVYFYTLQTNSYHETRKMIFLP